MKPWEQRAQELRTSGLGWKEVAATLNDEGYKTKLGKPFKQHSFFKTSFDRNEAAAPITLTEKTERVVIVVCSSSSSAADLIRNIA